MIGEVVKKWISKNSLFLGMPQRFLNVFLAIALDQEKSRAQWIPEGEFI
jgi:hypothetical protein